MGSVGQEECFIKLEGPQADPNRSSNNRSLMVAQMNHSGDVFL